MKKQISILLLTLSLTFAFAVPKTPKGTKLSVKKKFAIEGVELGSISWGKGKLTAKGEILWTETNEWQEIGWDFRGLDMSQYGAMRIELVKGNNDELRVLLTNAECTEDWVWTFSNNVAFVYFNGFGKGWGNLKDLNTQEGFLIRIAGENLQNSKTVIKKIELFTKDIISDNKNYNLKGVSLGSTQCNSSISDDGTIEWIWDGEENNPWIGWDVSNIDLSDMDRIRIEVDSSDVYLDIRLIQDGCHIGIRPISSHLLVAKFDGIANYWTWPEGAKWDPSKKIERIDIRVNSSNFSQNGYKSKIKAVELVPKNHGEVPEDFVKIKGGTFLMGNDFKDKYEYYTRQHQPVHKVTISYDYYMCDHEVTKEEYKTIMGAGHFKYEDGKYILYDMTMSDLFENDAAGEIHDNRPEDNVRWYYAVLYCNKRSVSEGLTPCYSMEIDGKDETDYTKWIPLSTEEAKRWKTLKCNFSANGYRLPTEAEWEYAARAGDNTIDGPIWSGTKDESKLGDYAWYFKNIKDGFDSTITSSQITYTHEVKKKLPNAWGLYDMTGNVPEWCWDWYPYKDGYRPYDHGYDTDANGVIDPTHGASLKSIESGDGGRGRIIRGGDYITDRSYYDNLEGFRIVRSDPGINKGRKKPLISGGQVESPTDGEGAYEEPPKPSKYEGWGDK